MRAEVFIENSRRPWYENNFNSLQPFLYEHKIHNEGIYNFLPFFYGRLCNKVILIKYWPKIKGKSVHLIDIYLITVVKWSKNQSVHSSPNIPHSNSFANYCFHLVFLIFVLFGELNWIATFPFIMSSMDTKHSSPARLLTFYQTKRCHTIPKWLIFLNVSNVKNKYNVSFETKAVAILTALMA